METPICAICAKTGVLCSACEGKLGRGQISALDVELSKILHESGLEGAGFERVIERGDYAIILTKKAGIGKFIGKGGENIRNLSQKLGKKIRVIGTENLQDSIHDFIAPARVSAINTVYTPQGGKIKRVRINGSDKKKLRMDIKDIENLLSSLTTDRIELSFEE